MTEALWTGEFGDAYTERNLQAGEGRGVFWRTLMTDLSSVNTALEVGCNVGANLIPLSEFSIDVTGVDVNQKALDQVPSTIPTRRCSASDLPFADASFDLTFTMGVLIHIPPEDLLKAMSGIVRCSSRYVLCGEYFAENVETVPYRGEDYALWRRDYGSLYLWHFPELKLIKRGFLSGGTWDDITWWLFERA